MPVYYQRCKDLTSDECMALLVWQNWNLTERQAVALALAQYPLPGACVRVSVLYNHFTAALGESMGEWRYLAHRRYMGYITVPDCQNTGFAGFALGGSAWLARFYSLQLKGLLVAPNPLGELVNFYPHRVMIPNTAP
jgi:hypothetical protein